MAIRIPETTNIMNLRNFSGSRSWNQARRKGFNPWKNGKAIAAGLDALELL
jgi:hypothetical protein